MHHNHLHKQTKKDLFDITLTFPAGYYRHILAAADPEEQPRDGNDDGPGNNHLEADWPVLGMSSEAGPC